MSFNFNCPNCKMSLLAEPQMAGQLVKCPGCDTKLQIPAFGGDWNADGSGTDGGSAEGGRPQRNVWKEEDPTNPNPVLSVGIGLGLTVAWFAFIYFFQAPPGKSPAEFTKGETLANLFYKHFTVSFANTLFFFWAAAICYLKMLKLKLQRRAMLLDVLPRELGDTINAQNVGTFIDHVYGLPVKLRDSLMVNRIRKALEFFEVRQNVSEVSSLMGSQSAIDGSRIMGSYILIRAFLWAIPLLGFIGTVVGLSHAISGMSFSNVEDVSKIVESINSVTSGLGTAFDATLLGLIFAVFLNFPLNSLAKHEEEALNDIDAYCNEVLLPRLDDGAAGSSKTNQSSALEDMGAITEAIVGALTNAQAQFLTDLNTLSVQMLHYANGLEARNEEYQQAALQTLANQMGALDQHALEHMEAVRQKQEEVLERIAGNLAGLEESTRTAYEGMVHSQNQVVAELTEKLASVSAELENTFTASAEITRKASEGIAEHIQQLSASTNALQGAEGEAIGLLGRKLDGLSGDLQKAFTSAVHAVGSDARALQDASKAAQEEAFRQFAERLGAMTKTVETTVASTLQQSGQVIGGLESGIRSLSSVLEQLNNKQVVIQEVKKRGWFSRG
jgi:biopolymer transport protein ExbB/TolQ